MKDLITPLAAKAAIRSSATTGAQRWLPDSTGRGAGRLLLRCRDGAGLWYFRYTRPGGRDDKYPIGGYVDAARKLDEGETGGAYSIVQARARADALSAMLKDPATADIRATLERRERERGEAEAAAEASKQAAQAARQARQRYTLAALLEHYCAHLERGGKASVKDVRALVTRHLFLGAPLLAAKPAREVTRGELAELLRTLMEAGKARTAGLLRAHFNAAYRLAQAAEGDASAPAALIAFHIDRNPVDGIKAVPVQKRDRVLNEAELRAFLQRLAAETGSVAALVRMSLLAGGQRPQQMLRATLKDYDRQDGTLLLLDGKGKRTQARAHLLPLGAMACAELDRLAATAAALNTQWLFTSEGKMPVQLSSMGKWMRELCAEMVAAGELRGPFQTKDLRRTAETMLAKLGISSDLRAQVLSHGLSGIQAARYDRHDYLDEKRTVLATWEAHLQAVLDGRVRSNVVALKRKA